MARHRGDAVVEIYEGETNLVGTVDDDGYVYDEDGNRVGSVSDDKVYNRNHQRVGAVSDSGRVFRGSEPGGGRRVGSVRDDGWIFRYRPDLDRSDRVGTVVGGDDVEEIYAAGAAGLLLLIDAN
jgi:YD repeat-containing protein